jgi:hypothetical protein
VKLSLFDIEGKEIMQILRKQLNAGEYETIAEMTEFPSGVYFYALEVEGTFVSSRKMLLIK